MWGPHSFLSSKGGRNNPVTQERVRSRVMWFFGCKRRHALHSSHVQFSVFSVDLLPIHSCFSTCFIAFFVSSVANSCFPVQTVVFEEFSVWGGCLHSQKMKLLQSVWWSHRREMEIKLSPSRKSSRVQRSAKIHISKISWTLLLSHIHLWSTPSLLALNTQFINLYLLRTSQKLNALEWLRKPTNGGSNRVLSAYLFPKSSCLGRLTHQVRKFHSKSFQHSFRHVV